jgi:hypothetical protein
MEDFLLTHVVYFIDTVSSLLDDGFCSGGWDFLMMGGFEIIYW